MCCFLSTDPRTKDWPLMSSPFPTLAICLTYVYIVKVSYSLQLVISQKSKKP